MMELDRFWSLVETSHGGSDDVDEQCAALADELRKLSAEDVVAFVHRFNELHDAAYSWDLWGAGYIMNGGCSDDGFHYFRSWVISRGRQVYENALQDPDSLAEVVSPDEEFFENEPIAYMPVEVWGELTGQSPDEFPHRQRTLTGPTGEPWDEEGDDLDRRFPKLCRVFDW